jgi:hypothetical protein
MKRTAVLISTVLIVLLALSASGCVWSTTNSTTNSTTTKDYTQHYNDAFKTGNFTGASFNKSKSADNNDLYTAVFTSETGNDTATVAIEVLSSQTAAQTKCGQVVMNDTNAGYLNVSTVAGSNYTVFSPGSVTPWGTVKSEWFGVNTNSGQGLLVYLSQDSGADNNWTVTTLSTTGT